MTETNGNLPSLIAEVSKVLARIEKHGTAPAAMGGFSFVREQDVIEALKPELDQRGIVLRPDVELLRLDTFPRQGKDMPNTVATISLALWAVRGAEEYLISRTVGQGADTQDKAVGKAVTAAKKQAILIAFAIPTGDDPDATAIPDRRPTPARRTQPEPGERDRQRSGLASPATTPAPVDLRGELARIASEKHLDTRVLSDYADLIGIPKGERATDEQLRKLIAAVDGHGTDKPLELFDQEANEGSSESEQSAASAGGPEAADPPSVPPVPPKPGTKEYRELPDGGARADARAYWQKETVTA